MSSQTNVCRLVLETLEPLPGDRKCFRMINGVLTERTVKEVVPILKTNSDGLKKALEELVKQYKSKQEEMEKWKVRLIHVPSCLQRPSAGGPDGVVGHPLVLNRHADCVAQQKKNNVQVVQQPQ